MTGNRLLRPDEAKIDVVDPILSEMTPKDWQRVERHLRASLEWDVREEFYANPPRTLRYAVRMQPDEEGEYRVTLNGFYSDFDSEDVVQTRVIIGLSGEYGFGMDRGNINRVETGEKVQLVVEDEPSQPGRYQSYVIVRGATNPTIEVYEQSHHKERVFTQRAIEETQHMLRAVKRSAKEIDRVGYAQEVAPEATVTHGTPSMVVDGDYGIYTITAWVNPAERGPVLLKAYNKDSGELMSGERMPAQTTRMIGWSREPETLFRYQAEATIYEGGFEDRFPVRFELWLLPDVGPDRLLVETSATVRGWDR